MKYGLLSGILWAIDTVVLGIALAMGLYAVVANASFVSACMHDIFAALILLVWMGVRGRLGDTIAAIKTRNGQVIMLAALLGGPIGMSGYLAAIENIGPGYTAAISAFYPAVGTLLAVLILKERMKLKQVGMLLLALLAIVCIGWSSTTGSTMDNPLAGILGALLCVFGWGSEAVILAWGMNEEAVDNETALQIRETTSALAYLLVAMPLSGSLEFFGEVAFTPENAVVGLAALAGVVSYLFYYKAIDCIGASRGMALNISYSAWAVLISAIVLHVIPSALEIVCCAVIIVGTVLSASPNWGELLGNSRKKD
ncbi:DMT family transporter [Atopobium fossor]|uniref:DMT family transporter n=1 Tax=Atopobium fossor TaxID=39487 RepID=UPI00041F5523|nr:DMT family transporter [Atopobium fossor]